MSKKDERQRVLEWKERIYLDDFFDGKTLEEAAEKIWATAAQHHQRNIAEDNLLKFRVEHYGYEDGDCLYLEVWRWETDAEMTKRQKKERVAEEKRKKKSEAAKHAAALHKQKESEKEYAEYLRLRAKFGDILHELTQKHYK